MSNANGEPVGQPLELLPYQLELVAFLKRHDPDIWNWFASSPHQASQADELRFELLKSAYRIERETQPALYEAADRVAAALNITAPITIYQSQGSATLNASLAFLPGEIHVILHGPLTTQLSPAELSAVLGHEFTHFQLWQASGGDLRIARDVLYALTNDSQAHLAHLVSLRLLRLYDEIVCDRGGFRATQDLGAVVSTLVKLETGTLEIDPESYLRQAEEIFARGPVATAGLSHPETFIRARAIQLWAKGTAKVDAAIAEMIEGVCELRELDLLRQAEVAGWTRRVIDLLLCHRWFQSDLTVGHARLYFEDYAAPTEILTDPRLAEEVGRAAKSVRDYFCFVLLDFVTADRDLDEPALAAALQVAEQLNLKPRFIELARQELRLRKNQLDKVDDRKGTIVEEADRQAAAAP